MPGIFNRGLEAIRNGISNAGNKIRWGAEKVGKFAQKALPVVQAGLNGLSYFPGVVGQAANMGKNFVEGAKKFIDAVPNSHIKDKLNSYADKANDMIDNRQGKANDIYHRNVAPIAGAIQQSHDKLKALLN
jgi:hypothetical protein